MAAAGASVHGASLMAATFAASCSIDAPAHGRIGEAEPHVRQRGLGQDEGGQRAAWPGWRRSPRAAGSRCRTSSRPRPMPSGARGLRVVALALRGHDGAHAARHDRPAHHREDARDEREDLARAAARAAAPRAATAPRTSPAAPARNPTTASARRPRGRPPRRRRRRRACQSAARRAWRRAPPPATARAPYSRRANTSRPDPSPPSGSHGPRLSSPCWTITPRDNHVSVIGLRAVFLVAPLEAVREAHGIDERRAPAAVLADDMRSASAARRRDPRSARRAPCGVSDGASAAASATKHDQRDAGAPHDPASSRPRRRGSMAASASVRDEGAQREERAAGRGAAGHEVQVARSQRVEHQPAEAGPRRDDLDHEGAAQQAAERRGRRWTPPAAATA